MAAAKGSFRRGVLCTCLALMLFIGIWAYCMVGAPQPVSGFTQQATLDVAHACGIHVFDPPAPKAGDAGPLRVSDLPEGSYIYTGLRPSQSPPRWVTVNPGGTISWLDIKTTTPVFTPVATSGGGNAAGASKKTAGKGKSPQSSGDDVHYESYEYPKVKWQAKPLDGKGAVAQLSTTYDSPSPNEQGSVKYRLTLFKAGAGKGTYRVQLLDEGGFKILEFKASDFQEVPGTQLLESRDSFSCPEEQYRQARDYAIN